MRLTQLTLGPTVALSLIFACTVAGIRKNPPSGDGDDTSPVGEGGLGGQGDQSSDHNATDDGDGDGDEQGSGGAQSAGPSGCAPGTAVSGVTASGETICSDCEEGEYCAGGDADAAPCEDGTWDHDSNPTTECVAWAECEPGEYVETPGRATNDRECTTCEDGYSNDKNAEDCTDWTSCEAGQYVLDPGSTTTDRSCDDCATGFTENENQKTCTEWSRCSGPTTKDGASTEDATCTAALAVTGGASHTCALFAGGAVWCWGSNQNGQVGISGTDDQALSRPVPGLSGVSQLDAGMNGSCALTGGSIKCWGSTGGLSATTLQGISGIADATSVASGANHSCAALEDGRVKCWGSNAYNQLTGSGDSTTPRLVTISGILEGVTVVSSSYYHTCALGSDLSVSCWGRNNTSQIGTTLFDATTDVISNASSIALGEGGTCVTRTGGVVCWGAYNAGENSSQRAVPDISGAVQVVGGKSHWCVLLDDGSVKCWGTQTYGELGNGTTGSSWMPVTVSNLEGVVTLGAGDNHTCAIVETGDVYCWGRNNDGQLGDGTKANRTTPVKVLAAE